MRSNGIDFMSSLQTFMVEAAPPARDVQPMDFRADRLFYLCDLVSLVQFSHVTPSCPVAHDGRRLYRLSMTRLSLTICAAPEDELFVNWSWKPKLSIVVREPHQTTACRSNQSLVGIQRSSLQSLSACIV